VRIILDDDEVSFDKDEPLQKRLQHLSGAGPSGAASAMPGEAATTTPVADMEATD
jgi:hypothetical protein